MDDFSAAPLDTASRVMTAIVFLMMVFPVYMYFQQGDFPLVALAVLPVITVISWGFSVRGYSLEPGRLVIQRPFFSKSIPLETNVSARPDPEANKGTVRVAGNGGLFGYYGTFRSRKLGLFTAYATNWRSSIVIETGGRTLVVTPEETEMFLSRLSESVEEVMKG